MATPKAAWSEQQIEERKRALKQDVQTMLESDGPNACLRHVLDEIARLESANAQSVMLDRFLHVMFALILHERHGGLAASEVRHLAELGDAILRVQGVKPETSRLSYLYGEIHLVLSQIHRRAGQVWFAAWEQQVANRLARRRPPGGKAFQALSFGLRALRLGDADVALAQFEVAMQGELARASFEQALVLRVNALRLSGRSKEAVALVTESIALMDLAAETVRELRWEEMCVGASSLEDLAPLLKAASKDGTHWHGSFVLETQLWALAMRSTQWMDRLPSLTTLQKRKELALLGHGTNTLTRCIRTLLDCYDGGIPFTLRLQRLGESLADLKHLLTIDKELLVWLAGARWLARNNYYELAALTLGEYVAVSRRLSAGRTRDVLGIAGDMLEKPWLCDLRRSA